MDVAETLDVRTRELVGVGSAVAANCLPCLRYHVAEAERAGCAAGEIKEATAIGLTVKSRPAADMQRLIDQLTNRLRTGEVPQADRETEGEKHADI
ncbi:MAG TPA: carboxymuconolactone decarboxylase family protein [Spirochaetia bacterium]|nr:carboxymuconolactone decarboxylase family protein [Spirochaetia bacterium]